MVQSCATPDTGGRKTVATEVQPLCAPCYAREMGELHMERAVPALHQKQGLQFSLIPWERSSEYKGRGKTLSTLPVHPCECEEQCSPALGKLEQRQIALLCVAQIRVLLLFLPSCLSYNQFTFARILLLPHNGEWSDCTQSCEGACTEHGNSSQETFISLLSVTCRSLLFNLTWMSSVCSLHWMEYFDWSVVDYPYKWMKSNTG